MSLVEAKRMFHDDYMKWQTMKAGPAQRLDENTYITELYRNEKGRDTLRRIGIYLLCILKCELLDELDKRFLEVYRDLRLQDSSTSMMPSPSMKTPKRGVLKRAKTISPARSTPSKVSFQEPVEFTADYNAVSALTDNDSNAPCETTCDVDMPFEDWDRYNEQHYSQVHDTLGSCADEIGCFIPRRTSEDLLNAVDKCVQNNSYGTFYLKGKPGTGKTLTCKWIAQELGRYRHVRCTYKTAEKHMKIREVYNVLKVSELFNVVVIDELDVLATNELAEVFDNLNRTPCVKIVLSNDYRLVDEFKYRLCGLEEFIFDAYKEAELEHILKARLATLPFNVFSEESLKLMVAHVGKYSGDCRSLMNIANAALTKCRDRKGGAGLVDPIDVSIVTGEIKHNRVDLNRWQSMFLYAVLEVCKKNKQPTLESLRVAYRDLVKSYMSYRKISPPQDYDSQSETVRSHCEVLQDYGLLKEFRTIKKGHYYMLSAAEKDARHYISKVLTDSTVKSLAECQKTRIFGSRELRI